MSGENAGTKSIRTNGGAPSSYDDYMSSRALAGEVWRDADNRPKAGSAYVFLADALEEVGFKLFSWTLDLSETTCPANNKEDPRYEGLSAAVSWIANAGRDEKLKAYLWRPGLTPYLKKPDFWYGGNDFRLFSECRINDNGKYGWIFVDADDLRRSIARATEPVTVPRAADNLGRHLSPYIRLMMAVIDKEQITPEHQPKKSVIEAAIAQLAPQFGLQVNPYFGNETKIAEMKAWRPDKGFAMLGETLLRNMATFIREISDQNMRGG